MQHILEIIGRDEIAMDVTYQEARKHDNLKEGRATKRRRRDGPSSQAPMVSNQRNVVKVSRVLWSYLSVFTMWF